MTIRLHRISMSRVQLDAIPEVERNLFVMLGHSANEIGVLAKLFHFCAVEPDGHEVFVKAQHVQALLFGRLLTGKIYEFWNLLQDGYFGSALSREYHGRLDIAAQTALDHLKRYFNSDNAIKRVRDSYAFHYDVRQIADGHRTLTDSEPLEVYLSHRSVNSLYAFSDTIAGRAMLEYINPGDPAKAFAMLIKETSKAIGWINEITGALMAALLLKHLGGTLYSLSATSPIEIEGAPYLQVVRIPYFVEVSTELTTESEGDSA